MESEVADLPLCTQTQKHSLAKQQKHGPGPPPSYQHPQVQAHSPSSVPSSVPLSTMLTKLFQQADAYSHMLGFLTNKKVAIVPTLCRGAPQHNATTLAGRSWCFCDPNVPQYIPPGVLRPAQSILGQYAQECIKMDGSRQYSRLRQLQITLPDDGGIEDMRTFAPTLLELTVRRRYCAIGPRVLDDEPAVGPSLVRCLAVPHALQCIDISSCALSGNDFRLLLCQPITTLALWSCGWDESFDSSRQPWTPTNTLVSLTLELSNCNAVNYEFEFIEALNAVLDSSRRTLASLEISCTLRTTQAIRFQ